MSNNRYSALNRRPGAASSLFQNYPDNNSTSGSRPSSSTSHTRPSYAYPGSSSSPNLASPYSTSSPNPNPSPYSYSNGKTSPPPTNSYHHAQPNSKGQYSASVLEELESQNENTATTLLSQKVSQLKTLTIAIGDEIRDSSSLASTINDQFENTGVRLKGTMRRMLRMAERTGVGWKVWVLFFLAVWALFAYVWLF